MTTYRTLADRSEFEPERIKGSRFVAVVAPCADEAAAAAEIVRVTAEHAGADHVCWAWRLRDGRTRSWDAAEPRGSAGRPILAQLEGHEIVDAVAIVARWFGGTKLGVGGLVRAYGGAAGMALDRAAVEVREPTVTLSFAYGWGDGGAVDAAVAGAGAVVVDTAWGDGVRRVVAVSASRAEAFVADLRDRTAGRVVAEPRGP